MSCQADTPMQASSTLAGTVPKKAWLAALPLVVLCVGCNTPPPATPTDPLLTKLPVAAASGVFAPLGQVRPDLPMTVRQSFARGLVTASRRFQPSEGVGPAFNASACIHCHDAPVPGATAGHYRDVLLARAASGASGQSPAGQLGVLAHYRVDAGGRNPTDPAATVLARRTPAPLFGVGLLAAVPDAEIERRADPDDSDGDGISGRVNRRSDGRVGRFGRKAELVELESVVRVMLFQHLGMTSEPLGPTSRRLVFTATRAVADGAAAAPAPTLPGRERLR